MAEILVLVGLLGHAVFIARLFAAMFSEPAGDFGPGILMAWILLLGAGAFIAFAFVKLLRGARRWFRPSARSALVRLHVTCLVYGGVMMAFFAGNLGDVPRVRAFAFLLVLGSAILLAGVRVDHLIARRQQPVAAKTPEALS